MLILSKKRQNHLSYAIKSLGRRENNNIATAFLRVMSFLEWGGAHPTAPEGKRAPVAAVYDCRASQMIVIGHFWLDT